MVLAARPLSDSGTDPREIRDQDSGDKFSQTLEPEGVRAVLVDCIRVLRREALSLFGDSAEKRQYVMDGFSRGVVLGAFEVHHRESEGPMGDMRRDLLQELAKRTGSDPQNKQASEILYSIPFDSEQQAIDPQFLRRVQSLRNTMHGVIDRLDVATDALKDDVRRQAVITAIAVGRIWGGIDVAIEHETGELGDIRGRMNRIVVKLLRQQERFSAKEKRKKSANAA